MLNDTPSTRMCGMVQFRIAWDMSWPVYDVVNRQSIHWIFGGLHFPCFKFSHRVTERRKSTYSFGFFNCSILTILLEIPCRQNLFKVQLQHILHKPACVSCNVYYNNVYSAKQVNSQRSQLMKMANSNQLIPPAPPIPAPRFSFLLPQSRILRDWPL